MDDVTLDSAIKAMTARLAEVREDRARMVADLKDLEQLERDLSVNLEGLMGTARLLQPEVVTAGPTPAPMQQFDNVVAMNPAIDVEPSRVVDLSTVSRSAAVTEVLRAASRPLGRQEIAMVLLEDHDRLEDVNNISLALTGLARSGRVEKLGRGLWRLTAQYRAELDGAADDDIAR